MLTALLGQFMTLISVILALAVEASVPQGQLAAPDPNQNDGFLLATTTASAVPDSTASIFHEGRPENMTKAFSWFTTHSVNIINEESYTLLSALIEMLSTEQTAPMGSTAESTVSAVPETTAVDTFSTEDTTIFMSTTASLMSDSTEMTTAEVVIPLCSRGVPVSTEVFITEETPTIASMESNSATFTATTAEWLASTEIPVTNNFETFSTNDSTLFRSTAASEGTSTFDSGIPTETTSPWETNTSEGATVHMSATADAEPTFIPCTQQTETISVTSDRTATTTTGITKPTATIVSETVTTEAPTSGLTKETTVSESTTAPSAATVPLTTIIATEAMAFVSTFGTTNPTSIGTTTKGLLTAVPTETVTATVQATAQASTEPTTTVASMLSTKNPTSTAGATELFPTTAMPTLDIPYKTTAELSTEMPTLTTLSPTPLPQTPISTATTLSTEMTTLTTLSPTPLPQTPISTTTTLSTEMTTFTTPTPPTLTQTPLSTTTTLSTAMPAVPSVTTQTATSNHLTSVQSTTPEMRLSPSVVENQLNILEQENVTVKTVEKIAEQLANVTTNAVVLSLSSALKATKIVANISDLISNNNFTKEMYPVPKLIGQIAAGLMTMDSTDLASVESQSKVSVQQSLEKSLSALALAAIQNGSTINETYLKLQDDNLAFQVVINTSISGIRIGSASSLSQALLEMVPYDNASTTSASSSPVQSKNETLIKLSSSVAQSPKTFIVYNNAKLFQAKDGLQPESNGRVVSAQLPGNTIKKEELIKIAFPPMLDNLERKCGYWNYSAKAWSTEGCNSVIGDDNSVICTCEHLTNFAVLLAVNNVPPNPELDILSKIGLSLSCASLAAVVITFLAIKKMRRTISQKVLFNLALSLLILDLLFLLGIDKTSSRNGCIAIAALLHYFLLTSFMWMLMESILQYLRFVKVLGIYIPKFLPKTVVPAWGIPAIIVAIVSGVDVSLYDGGQKLYCMAQKEVIYYAVLLPIGIVLVINWAIFIVVLKSFCCHRRLAYQSNRSESSLAKLHAQAGVAVCTLLGLTWVFGFLTAIPDATTSVAFQWLFCICNTLQGFVIFLFHCLRENALRKELRRLCCRSGPLAALSLSEDSSAASKTASSVMSRSQSVSMATISSSSIGGSSMLTFHKGSYSFTDADRRTRQCSEVP